MIRDAKDYKETGVGWLKRIPKDWDIISSKRLFSERKERARPDDRQMTASQKYGVIYQDEFMRLENQKVVQVIIGSDILKHVEPYDFVISMRSFQGGLEYSRDRGCISSAYVMLIPSADIVPEYFRYLFKSSAYIQALQATSNLVRDGQAMRYGNFAQVPLPVVPKSEQREIADFLDRETSRIDRLVDKKEQLVKLLDQKKGAEIIRKCAGIPSTTSSVSDKKVIQELVHSVGLPKEWKLGKFHNVFTVRKNNKNTGMTEDNLLSLSYGNIVQKDMSRNEGLIPESYETYQIVYPGDIVLRLTDLQNDKRSIRQGLVKEKGIVTSAYDAVYVGREHDPVFWAYTLLSLDLAKYYYSLGGGVRQSVKFRDIPNMLVKFPNLEEQKKISASIAENVKKIDDVIAKTKTSINSLHQFRSSLITEAVTGQLDIHAWAKRGAGDRGLDKIEEEIEQKKSKKASA